MELLTRHFRFAAFVSLPFGLPVPGAAELSKRPLRSARKAVAALTPHFQPTACHGAPSARKRLFLAGPRLCKA